MDISIVIPSFNTETTIGNTLKAIVDQRCSASFEILVIDCSSHTKVEEIARQFPNVRYEHKVERFNPGVGRNIGAHLAKGKLLIFLDSDIRLAQHVLQASWDRFSSGLKIFGGALEIDADACNDTASYLEHYFFNHESQPGRHFQERANLSSAFMCFDRSIFLSEGGFKDIPRMQDTELTERLRKKGFKLYFCPEMLAYQVQDSPFGKVLKKIYINGQNLYYIRYQAKTSHAKKLVFLLFLPAISAAKVARIVARHLVYQTNFGRWKTIQVTPALFLGGIYWMAGFYHALITQKGISSKR